MNIRDFIVKAKKSTYASGKKPKLLDDGFEEFFYKEEDYEYRDRYYAKDRRPFGGEEVVWKKGKAVWIMNYYGFVLDNKIGSATLYGFLRKAMSLVSKDSPFRGANLEEGDFEYKNQSEGDIARFNGVERIFFKGKEVYRLEYHGGEL